MSALNVLVAPAALVLLCLSPAHATTVITGAPMPCCDDDAVPQVLMETRVNVFVP